MSKTTASKSKSPSKSAGGKSPALDGLTPAQSRALKLVRRGSKFTVRDVVDHLIVQTAGGKVGGGSSLSLARAHVRAWVEAGYVEATTPGSQGVAGKYKRLR